MAGNDRRHEGGPLKSKGARTIWPVSKRGLKSVSNPPPKLHPLFQLIELERRPKRAVVIVPIESLGVSSDENGRDPSDTKADACDCIWSRAG